MFNFFKSEKGSIIILALAFFMITIFVFGFIIDQQRLQLARQKIYIAADMAALAGAREIDEDLAMGIESAIINHDSTDDPANGPIAFIKEIEATGVAQTVINNNQFDKGASTWLGHGGSKIIIKDVDVDNGNHKDDKERRIATIRVQTQYTVKPFILSIMGNESTVYAESKSVIYLVL